MARSRVAETHRSDDENMNSLRLFATVSIIAQSDMHVKEKIGALTLNGESNSVSSPAVSWNLFRSIIHWASTLYTNLAKTPAVTA